MEVSVLIPARDAAATLPLALRSVLEQREVALELIAVDDGSTDATGAILAEAARRDGRVRVLQGEGRGIARALALGLASCGAPWVARMDADDVAHRDRLAVQLAAARREPAVGVWSSRVRVLGPARDGMRRYVRWQNALGLHEEMARDRFVECPLVHPSALLKRDVLDLAGGWRDGPFPEDYDLWLRLFAGGVRFGKVPRALLGWRESAGRLTRTDARYGEEAHRALKARALALGPLRGVREVILWGAGPTGKRFARALEREGIRAALFVDVDPRKIGRERRGAPVVAEDALAQWKGKAPLLAAVGAAGARADIRARLAQLGWTEEREFWCVA